MDDFHLSDDKLQRLRTLAGAPGDFEYRMEVLTQFERITTQYELFSRAVVGDLKRLNASQLKPGQITKIVQSELGPTNKDLERLWSAGTWAVVGTVAALFSGMIALIVMMSQMMKVLPK